MIKIIRATKETGQAVTTGIAIGACFGLVIGVNLVQVHVEKIVKWPAQRVADVASSSLSFLLVSIAALVASSVLFYHIEQIKLVGRAKPAVGSADSIGEEEIKPPTPDDAKA
ncbi:hypothetical protein HNP46_004164 [Pseudomonas nitritireducens]|uniref:Uncharacterized protein n=1 Tax=Pseudomonas nitroreducens TaxID=46680 RepID=A0A7W7P1W9_PSENT|nr:hypothetical protein [Pseudomonas nitritireducens]MBB4865283.1 hypothetical protein [Pseudomonas nitritireducens]